MKAARTARNMVTSTKADLEEALEKASKVLTKSGKNAAQLQISNLGKELLQLKNLLAGKSKAKTREAIKEVLAATANVIKAARDEIKELRRLGNKAGSASGSRQGRWAWKSLILEKISVLARLPWKRLYIYSQKACTGSVVARCGI